MRDHITKARKSIFFSITELAGSFLTSTYKMSKEAAGTSRVSDER